MIGVFLYYGRAIDSKTLAAIGSISSNISTSQWKDIQFRTNHFLDYIATHPNAKIIYKKSDMHLWTHTDASYFTEPKARSRAGGYIFLSKKTTHPIDPSSPAPPDNGSILVIYKIIDTIMASAMEAEIGAALIHAKVSH